MSANFSAKQQRIASSLAAQGSENPCLRCLPKYATDYGKPGFEECRFPDMGLSTSAHTAEGPDGEDLTYYVCYRCEFSGQHCFEVA